MKKSWLLLVFVLLILAGCRKDEKITPAQRTYGTTPPLSVSSVFQSNMVIQRSKPVAIWGQAPANEPVTIHVSWNTTILNATADASGNWKVTVPSAASNANPQTITVNAAGFTTITLKNILIGDVWVCSGQSNMVMPIDTMAPFTGVLNYQSEIAAANYPQIRMLTIQEDAEVSPISKLSYSATWNICSPATVGQTSAVAYYFAQKLNTTLNVPIGIIISAVNGSWCQDWTNVEAIQNNAILATNYLNGSSTFYNGMISPLTGLTIKGFIWYQGENNQHDSPPSNYTLLNTALINGWRTKFNQSGLPFYYVQLTPFAEDYNTTTPPGGDPTADYLAMFREAQANIRKTATGTGMAVTMDVGEPDDHHPPDKKPVGERLALLALNYTYGQQVQCLGPQYASFSVNQYAATVNFISGTANGLSTINNAPLNQYFFVAGTDQVFRQGQAVISGNSIIITAPQGTPLPIQAVRYAFTDAPVTNLQNSAGLPAEPFRTDSWTN